ncbi:MAG TPA: heavy-metal-associated domain-containing protein [Gemmatimonadaceae bacterium]|nr:heavy-metal-associated domain-containing protein [Gemmatimonadaceae bacterium]
MERVTIQIDGMSCGHCVAAVGRALRAVPGVDVEQVAIGSATIAYDPGAVSLDRIRAAVRAEGYAPRDTAPGGAGR